MQPLAESHSKYKKSCSKTLKHAQNIFVRILRHLEIYHYCPSPVIFDLSDCNFRFEGAVGHDSSTIKPLTQATPWLLHHISIRKCFIVLLCTMTSYCKLSWNNSSFIWTKLCHTLALRENAKCLRACTAFAGLAAASSCPESAVLKTCFWAQNLLFDTSNCGTNRVPCCSLCPKHAQCWH